MLSLSLDLPRDRAPRLLVLGAHSDDIEIGCGGTVRFLLERHPGAEVRWVVFAAGNEARAAEARAAAARFLRGAGQVAVETHRFRDGFFPAEFAGLKEVFEALKAGPAGMGRPTSSSPNAARITTRTIGSSRSSPGTHSATPRCSSTRYPSTIRTSATRTSLSRSPARRRRRRWTF